MKRMVFLWLVSMFFLPGCGDTAKQTTDTTAPASPSNIKVIAGNMQARVTWQVNTESDLKSYTLYWGQAANNLVDSATLDKAASSKTITDLSNGNTYFFALEAQDQAGNRSSRSNVVSAVPGQDTTKPTLVSSTPANNATAVSIDLDRLVFNFSEPLNISTVALSSPNYDTAKLIPEWNAEHTTVSYSLPLETLLEQPTAQAAGRVFGLEYFNLYTFTVSGKDLAGNNGSVTLNFTTQPDSVKPTVLSSVPSNTQTDVPINSSITVTFSEAMDRASLEANFSISPTVVCNFAWSSEDSSVSCTPQNPFAEQTPYTVTMGTAAKDKAGNILATSANNPFIFTTGTAPDLTAPTVTSFIPANDASGEVPEVPIAITFSEPMNQASLESAFSGTLSNGGVNTPLLLSGVARFQDSTTYFFMPQAPFAYNTDVSWQLGLGAKDLAGNALAQEATAAFRVLRQQTVSIEAKKEITGTIKVDRELLDHYVASSDLIKYGDSSNSNIAWRGFVGFDLSLLPFSLSQITNATLSITQYRARGAPFALERLGVLYLERVNYGETLGGSDDFNTPLLACSGGCQFTFFADPSEPTNVTNYVRADWNERDNLGLRSEYLLRFSKENDGNNGDDFLEYHSATSTTLSALPILTVTYLYP